MKERLHQMVDEMTEEEAEATLRRVTPQRTDSLVRFFDAAPVDDEPVTAEEEAAVAQADADRAQGVPTIPFDEIRSLSFIGMFEGVPGAPSAADLERRLEEREDDEFGR